MFVSKGSKRFFEFCQPHGRMLAMAAELGAQQSIVSRWASGDRKPSAPWRLKIREKTGIDFPEWDQPADDEAVEGAEGAA